MKKTVLITGFFLLAIFGFTEEKCIPTKPSPPHLVNNFSKESSDFLSPDEQQQLEDKLENFSKETSNQIVIVIVDDLCGYDANEFSTKLGQAWGVGQGKFDNGVVIMVKPSGEAGQRDAYIAVGYGLEGRFTGRPAKKIVNNEVISNCKAGQAKAGLSPATDVLMSLAKKEFSYTDYNTKKSRNEVSPFSVIGLMLLMFLLAFIFRKRGRYTSIGGRRTYYGGGWGSGFGGFGGGSSGGGGFGGFGGGGFGGGGAGGKW